MLANSFVFLSSIKNQLCYSSLIQQKLRDKLQCNTNSFKPISFNNEQLTTACKQTLN